MIGHRGRGLISSSVSDSESDDESFSDEIAAVIGAERPWERSASAEDINKDFKTTTGKPVIILLDVDCYEVQLWVTQRNRELLGKDVPIVIINADYVVLSVNYSARGLGIGRSFTYGQLEPFRRNHPNLVVLQTGLRCDRTDSWTPQLESDKILNALKHYKKDLGKHSMCVERNCRDEFYIDVTNLVNSRSEYLFVPRKAEVERLTSATKEDPCREHFGMPKTVLEDYNGEYRGDALRNHILQVLPKKKERHHEDAARLIHGAVIADEIIKLIREKTGYHCSAGVAQNKLLAKMACSRNKPTGITIVTEIAVGRMWKSTAIRDLPGLGGKQGEELQDFLDGNGCPVKNLFDLQHLAYSQFDLIEFFYESMVGSKQPAADALHLKKMLSGMDSTPVFPKVHSDSMTASITFKGRNTSRNYQDLQRSIKEFCGDIEDRLNYTIKKSRRYPDEIAVKVTLRGGSGANHKWVGNNRLEEVVANEPGKAEIEALIMNYIQANHLTPEQIEAVKVTAKNMYVFEETDMFPGEPNRMLHLAWKEIYAYLQNRLELNDNGYRSGEDQVLPREPNLANADIPVLSPAEFEKNVNLIKRFDAWLSKGGPFWSSEISGRIGRQQLKLTPHVDPKTRTNIAEALHYKMIYLYFKRKNNAAKAMLKSGGILCA